MCLLVSLFPKPIKFSSKNEHGSLISTRNHLNMGIAERKARDKENLRALILQGAKKLFVEHGIEQTTIRKIAEEINYSVGTIYVYFKDKNAILHALHSQGFSELGSRFQVLFKVKDPMERLRSMGRVYLDTDLGFGLVHTQDVAQAAEAVEGEQWSPQDVLASELPERFGFVPSPQAAHRSPAMNLHIG